jgi:hypothetical protein
MMTRIIVFISLSFPSPPQNPIHTASPVFDRLRYIFKIHFFALFLNIMQSTIRITELYDLLSEKIGKEQANMLVKFVEEKVEGNIEEKTKYLATKQDISEAKADMLKWIIVLFSPFYIGLIAFLVKYFFRT